MITGDLVESGSRDEYAMLGELLSELSAPSFVIPGNHDEREAFRAAFIDHPYLPRVGPLHYCIERLPRASDWLGYECAWKTLWSTGRHQSRVA